MADPVGDTRTVMADGTVSQMDVWSLAINSHAFSGDPDAAHDFVLSLPNATYMPEGVEYPISMHDLTDEGVASLASAALVDSPTLVDQTVTVAFLPESVGGVRNALITTYYSELGTEFNEWMNPDAVDPLDLSEPGHTGANWFNIASFASVEVGGPLGGDDMLVGVGATADARQMLADGNQVLFTETAVRGAMFLDAFPPGSDPTPEQIEAFFNRAVLPYEVDGNDPPLFDDGDAQIRDAFVEYFAARDETDATSRQALALQGNLNLGIHEQAAAQEYLDRVIDQGTNDGVLVVADVFDTPIAAALMNPDVGDFSYQVDVDMPAADAAQSAGNLLIGSDLTTDLNPANVEVDALLDGVALSPITGWETQFDVDPGRWHDTDGWYTVQPGVGPELDGPTDGVADQGALEGPDVGAWQSFNDRMWNITNLFHQNHTNVILVTLRPSLATGTIEGFPDVWLPPELGE